MSDKERIAELEKERDHLINKMDILYTQINSLLDSQGELKSLNNKIDDILEVEVDDILVDKFSEKIRKNYTSKIRKFFISTNLRIVVTVLSFIVLGKLSVDSVEDIRKSINDKIDVGITKGIEKELNNRLDTKTTLINESFHRAKKIIEDHSKASTVNLVEQIADFSKVVENSKSDAFKKFEKFKNIDILKDSKNVENSLSAIKLFLTETEKNEKNRNIFLELSKRLETLNEFIDFASDENRITFKKPVNSFKIIGQLTADQLIADKLEAGESFRLGPGYGMMIRRNSVPEDSFSLSIGFGGNNGIGKDDPDIFYAHPRLFFRMRNIETKKATVESLGFKLFNNKDDPPYELTY